MKAINKFLYMMLMVFGMTFSFSACSSDDDKETIENPNEALQDGKWTVNGNTYTYTVKQDYGYVSWSMKWTVKFDNSDKCVSSKCENTFSDKTMAQAFYDEWKSTESDPATLSGKTVTIDYTDSHKGMPKSTLLALIEAMGGAL